MQDQLIIFDTTMRDGEQSPGAAMTKDDKTAFVALGPANRVAVALRERLAQSRAD